MKKIVFSIFSLMLAASLMVGCGSTSTPATSSPSPAPTAPVEEIKDDVLKKIETTKSLVVGTDATFAPFEFKNSQKEYDGFDIDLVRAVAAQLGADKVEFVDTEFKGLIPGLQGKKFDMIVSAMYITDERKKTIDFSDSYYPGGLSIMVARDNDEIKSIDDLKGKKVSVQIGTKSAKFLKEEHPDIKLVEVEKNVEMFLELESKRVDAVVTGRPAAKVYTKEHPTVKVLDQELTEEHYGYGVRKENEEFTKAINAALKKVKENGTYEEIVKKWFGE